VRQCYARLELNPFKIENTSQRWKDIYNDAVKLRSIVLVGWFIKIFGNFKMGLSERYAMQAVRLYVCLNNPPQQALSDIHLKNLYHVNVGEYLNEENVKPLRRVSCWVETSGRFEHTLFTRS